MRLLLDTNAFIWLSDSYSEDRLGEVTRRLVCSDSVVYVSAISIVELQIKAMLGKIEMVPLLNEEISKASIALLDFKASHADAIVKFPELARHDPFDRMLLAQAATEELTFLTADQLLLDLGLNFVMDARL